MQQPPANPTTVRRIALLQHGGLLGLHGKTGISLLRYRASDIVAVIDQDTAGRDAGDVTRIAQVKGVPIVASVQEALAFKPEVIAIGIATPGGKLPDAWLEELRTAVRAGVSLWNGLHVPLAKDPVIASALNDRVYVWDMRQEPAGLPVASAAARNLACRRVLFVGTDMAIGKMTAALELDRSAKARGLRSKFIATGQTGMMIAGDGIPLDAVRIDFSGGAVESEMMKHGPDHDILWVEGQGSLVSPASTATLPLMRGSQATHLILVHLARMKTLRAFPFVKVPPLRDVIRLNELVASAAGGLAPAKVVGVALNTWGLSDAEAAAECEQTERETGLPCVDAVRHGGARLLDAVLAEPPARIDA
jgi:uncharacterized NAD-dependent epimerase/dehydratase family protein